MSAEPDDRSSAAIQPPRAAARPRVRPGPAISPRLRILFYVVMVITGLLGANSAYLASITALESWTGQTYQDYFYQQAFLGHIVLGLLLIVPFLIFGVLHLISSRNRPNRRAVRVGYALFITSIVVLVSGLLLLRISGFEIRSPAFRSAIYWLHVILPVVACWLYWLHRLAGMPIRSRQVLSYIGVVGGLTALLVLAHTRDPRKWNQVGSSEGDAYFRPSLAKTDTGKFIPANVLQMDDYCAKCHADAHAGWKESAHRFSSFNNPAYLASVRETRDVSLQRDGSVRAARWCAGCHDPVPFFSGAFDDPKFDDVRHSTAHAGITCTVCHAMTHVNSTQGNADYTIEEPLHYPFASSSSPFLQWVNLQLVKAKPSFHRRTFLKDFHKSEEFCSTCHKVHLPKELNHYKEFLRGQNHYDSFLLSGVSGHGARSFYYPPKAEENCAGCHMPLKPSGDFGARRFAGAEALSIHDHMFPAANTALPWFRENSAVEAVHTEFLQNKVRVDIFGLREEGQIDGKLHAPLRPEVPALESGRRYLLDVVVRTLKLGHHFTQGTVDSNEVWVDVTVRSGDRVIGRSGALDEHDVVDPWSHFINVFMLDRNGNRINRRNPQDIFVPLYDHQIPPGSANVVHYDFTVPEGITDPVTVEVQLKYRKFDAEFVDYFTKKARPGDLPIRGHQPGVDYGNPLPIVVMAKDSVTFPVGASDTAVQTTALQAPDIPPWQRWNDYGIGMLLKGKATLRQAAEAFEQVEGMKRVDGPLNLARVYHAEGRLDEAVEAVKRAAEFRDPPAPPWTLAWLSGLTNREQGHLAEAEKNFRQILEDRTAEMVERGLDFSRDYEVRNLLGLTLFDRARQLRAES
ncbi:MAG: multiheme c-type cytochrome, partial [Planctomyces sp.]